MQHNFPTGSVFGILHSIFYYDPDILREWYFLTECSVLLRIDWTRRNGLGMHRKEKGLFFVVNQFDSCGNNICDRICSWLLCYEVQKRRNYKMRVQRRTTERHETLYSLGGVTRWIKGISKWIYLVTAS